MASPTNLPVQVDTSSYGGHNYPIQITGFSATITRNSTGFVFSNVSLTAYTHNIATDGTRGTWHYTSATRSINLRSAWNGANLATWTGTAPGYQQIPVTWNTSSNPGNFTIPASTTATSCSVYAVWSAAASGVYGVLNFSGLPSYTQPPVVSSWSASGWSDTAIAVTVDLSSWGQGYSSSNCQYSATVRTSTSTAAAARTATVKTTALSASMIVDNSSEGSLTIIPNQNYYVWYNVTNGVGSAGERMSTQICTNPAPVTNSEQYWADSDGSVHLGATLGASGGAYAQDVEYRVDTGAWQLASTIPAGKTTATSFEFDITNLQQRNYAYLIDFQTESEMGWTSSGASTLAFTAPPEPSSFTVTNVSATSATFEAVIPAQGGALPMYFLYESEDKRFDDEILVCPAGVTGQQTVTFTVDGLTPDTEYVFYATTENDAGYAEIVTVTFNTSATSKFYVSANGVAEPAKKLYASVDGQTKKIKKLYGSVDGKTKLVFEDTSRDIMVYYSMVINGWPIQPFEIDLDVLRQHLPAYDPTTESQSSLGFQFTEDGLCIVVEMGPGDPVIRASGYDWDEIFGPYGITFHNLGINTAVVACLTAAPTGYTGVVDDGDEDLFDIDWKRFALNYGRNTCIAFDVSTTGPFTHVSIYDLTNDYQYLDYDFPTEDMDGVIRDFEAFGVHFKGDLATADAYIIIHAE